jgi:hypothetical protein
MVFWIAIPSRRLKKANKGATVKQQEMMVREVDVCVKNWKLHLMTPPIFLKSPSSITKISHVKFQATSGSLANHFVVIL